MFLIMIVSIFSIILLILLLSKNKNKGTKGIAEITNEPDEKNSIEKVKEDYVWEKTLRVKGTSYRDEINLLYSEAHINELPYWGMEQSEIREYLREELDFFDYARIYEFDSFDTENFELIPEPDNEFDPNAIKVIVEGYFLGYVSKGYAKQLKKFSDRSKFSFKGEAHLLGGRYKELRFGERRVHNGELNLSCKIDLKIKALD